MYTDGATPEGLLQRLQGLQASSNPREQSVAKCMIFNLFDEYRFFNKYPEKELHITAVLFSGLVHLRLVEGQQLDTLLRLVLDALRQPPDSKLFDFARETLRQVQDSLLGWPQFCSYVLQACPPHRRCRTIRVHNDDLWRRLFVSTPPAITASAPLADHSAGAAPCSGDHLLASCHRDSDVSTQRALHLSLV